MNIPAVKVSAGVIDLDLPRLKLTASVLFQICTKPMGVTLTIKEETIGITLPSITKNVNMPQTYEIPIEIPVQGVIITVKIGVKISGNTIAELQVEVLLNDVCARPKGYDAGGTFDICLTELEGKLRDVPLGAGDAAWDGTRFTSSVVPDAAKRFISTLPFTLVTVAAADYGVACRAKPSWGKSPGSSSGGGGSSGAAAAKCAMQSGVLSGTKASCEAISGCTWTAGMSVGGINLPGTCLPGNVGGGAAAAAIIIILLLLFIGGAAAFMIKTRRCGVVACYMPSAKVAPATGGRITEGMLRYRGRGRGRGEWEIGRKLFPQ